MGPERRPRGTSGAPVLVNTADNSSRRRAYETRVKLWELSSLPRVRNCGRVPTGLGGAFIWINEEGKAGVGGLQSCGSPWACPVCSRGISSERSREVVETLRNVPSAALVTLTVRHSRSDHLDHLWDAVTKAWGSVTSGARYQKDKDTFGIKGWVRAIEVTHGEAGWHVHVHCLVAFDSVISEDLMRELGERFFVRWERALGRKGFEAVADRGGLDVRRVRMGDAETVASYLTKIGLEMTSPKKGRCNNRTPFQILSDALETGSHEDLSLWYVWEKVSLGRKQLTWSKGFRVKAEAVKVSSEELFILPPETWEEICREVIDLLEAVEAGIGEPWLLRRGLEFIKVRQPDLPPEMYSIRVIPDPLA